MLDCLNRPWDILPPFFCAKMSRHSGSSRYRSHHSRNTEENPEDLVEQVKSIITLLYEVVSSRPYEWEAYLPSARSAMTALDHIRFFRDPQRFAEQVWMLHGLQDYAFHDADSGCIRDIAEWCQTAWLRILRNYPENVETLTGMPSPTDFHPHHQWPCRMSPRPKLRPQPVYPFSPCSY